MVKVGFIVEGESEKLVVESPMFQQWLHDHDCTLVTPVIDAKGGGNLLPQHIEPFRAANNTLLASLRGLAVHLVLSAAACLARRATLSFVNRS